MTRTVYLKSYDLYAEILEYTLPEGKFAILSRDKVEASGIPFTFGAFCREGQQVAGVFATPDGPVFFLDAQHVVGRYGQTYAWVKDVPQQNKRHFAFDHQDKDRTVKFSLIYEKRLGIGANPYDNQEEDIDLLAMIASNSDRAAFYRAYTKEWVGQP